MKTKNMYESKLTRAITPLHDDLIAGKITEDEFKILLGVYIQREFAVNLNNDFWELVKPIMKKSTRSGAKYVGYNWKRIINEQ